MIKLLRYSLMLCFFVTSIHAQKAWKDVSGTIKEQGLLQEVDYPSASKVFSLNMTTITNQLKTAPERGVLSGPSNTIFSIPDSEGNMLRYRVEEASVFAPELQARYPEIRSYAGYGIDDPSAYARFSISPHKGISGIVLTGERKNTLMIEPFPEDVSKAIIFKKTDRKGRKEPFVCATVEDFSGIEERVADTNEVFSADDSILRTFDLAMSVTGEYTAYHGGTLAGANAAIAATMTRVNGVYEMDFNVNMVIVATNDNVVYTNAGTDPYGPTDANYNSELQSTLDAQIGSANYDVGHLMSGIGNNGNAGCIGCVCVAGQKGSGFTTSTVPEGDNFDIDFVAHELGHQFGANHTWTHGGNEGTNVQMEPGSGSTIMGYAGITGATDVQPHSDPYFHAASIAQATAHAKSRTCDVETPTGNDTPVVNAGADLTLPIGTAFRLTGSATDADSGLTYCWEQYDENNAADAYPDPASADSNRPLFRSYNPSTSTMRTFPLMADLVANGVNGNIWEKVPTVGRTADFRLTVRDNRAGGGNNDFDDMIVTWDVSRGPLEVTSQATTGINWNQGDVENITWNVNSTNLMGGASNVDILLSIDGGVTFPTVLASNIANDGSESVTVPNVAAPYCRLMIQPTGAPFFAINTEDFAIGYIVTTTCTQYPSGPVGLAIPDGVGANMPGPVVTDVINITDTTTITDINVNVDISHTWVGDLQIALDHPDATQVLLWNRDCNGGANTGLDVVFDDDGGANACANPVTGRITASASLSGFNGKTLNGDWTLLMVDNFNADTGTLNDWYVESCTTTEVLSVNEVAFDELTLYPVPNKGDFIIALTSTSGLDIQINIHDIRGRRVYESSFVNGGAFNEEINISSAQSGIYFVTITDGERKEVKKIVIE